MKQTLFSVLVLSIFVAAQPQNVTLALFGAFNDYVTRNHCLERALVVSTCQGKCYLLSQLEADQQEHPTQQTGAEETVETVLHFPLVQPTVLFADYLASLRPNRVIALHLREIVRALWKPPRHVRA